MPFYTEQFSLDVHNTVKTHIILQETASSLTCTTVKSTTPCRGVGVGSIAPCILNLSLEGGEWSASTPSHFTLEERTLLPLEREFSGPQSSMHILAKILPYQEFNYFST